MNSKYPLKVAPCRCGWGSRENYGVGLGVGMMVVAIVSCDLTLAGTGLGNQVQGLPAGAGTSTW